MHDASDADVVKQCESVQQLPTNTEAHFPAEPRELIVFTVSDSSGETAEAVARAALVQFPPGRLFIVFRRCAAVSNLPVWFEK